MQVPTRTRDDFFNGICAVRFNYPNHVAYVSIAFDADSDDIYLLFKDSNGDPVSGVSYVEISEYYDSEIKGSRDDIKMNLDLPALNKRGSCEYVYAFVAPYGESDTTVREKLGIYGYLIERGHGPRDVWATWDMENGVYNRVLKSKKYA